MAEADPPKERPQPKGSEAAAILRMWLGDEEAADVLSRLEPDEVQHLGSAMFDVAVRRAGLNQEPFTLATEHFRKPGEQLALF